MTSFYWADPGLVRAVKRQPGPVMAEETGPLFEGFVPHLLRAHAELPGVVRRILVYAG